MGFGPKSKVGFFAAAVSRSHHSEMRASTSGAKTCSCCHYSGLGAGGHSANHVLETQSGGDHHPESISEDGI
jgi:hypothetical protein